MPDGAVEGPVPPLTLLATIGDGVTPGTLRLDSFFLPITVLCSFVTLVTSTSVCHVLWHDANDKHGIILEFLKKYIFEIHTLISS